MKRGNCFNDFFKKMCFYAKFPSTKVLSTKYLSILNFLYYKDVIDSHIALIGIFQNVFGR